jgi:DoxX-like family
MKGEFPMLGAYIAVAGLTAAANGFAGVVDFLRPAWLIENMTRVRVRRPMLAPLAVLKIAGAAGLLIGIAVPGLGVAAAIGLVLFFVGALTAHLRVHDYSSIPFPGIFLLLAIASLVLRAASS